MDIRTELKRRCPEMDITKPFGEWPWGSLEWAGFLNEIMETFPPDKKDLAVQKLFIQKNFRDLTARQLEDIVNELGR